MKSFLSVAVLLILVSACPSVTRAEEGERFTGEKAVIKEVVEVAIGWALNKDTELLFDSVARDEDFFYFSPDDASTISGFEMFKEFTYDTFMGDHFKALWFETKEMAINISRSGDVAWYHCLLDDVGLWDGEEAGWHDVRWTGVLEKRNGKWVIVQMHFSFSVEQMLDKGTEDEAVEDGDTPGEDDAPDEVDTRDEEGVPDEKKKP